MSSAKWRPFCLGLNVLTLFKLTRPLTRHLYGIWESGADGCSGKAENQTTKSGSTKNMKRMAHKIYNGWLAWSTMDGSHDPQWMAHMICNGWLTWSTMDGSHDQQCMAQMINNRWLTWSTMDGSHDPQWVAHMIHNGWLTWSTMDGSHDQQWMSHMINNGFLFNLFLCEKWSSFKSVISEHIMD